MFLSASWASQWAGVGEPQLWDVGVVTYVDYEDWSTATDGAVLLGLSLQAHLPNVPRFSLVEASVPSKYRKVLVDAGWRVLEIDNDFGELNVFRLNLKTALFMRSDMLVYTDHIQELVDGHTYFLLPGHVAMVEDTCGSAAGGTYNTGLMILQPGDNEFKGVKTAVESHSELGTSEALQAAINDRYEGNVKRLPAKFNAHHTYQGSGQKCDDIVVAQFTGPWKPTSTSADLQKTFRLGESPEHGLDCGDRYDDYYCKLRDEKEHVTEDLRNTLDMLGSCIPEPPPLDIPMAGVR